MADQVSPLSTDDSQFRMLPVCPLSINVPVVVLSQTNALLNRVPPTLFGLTKIVPLTEFELAQGPL